MVCRMLQDKTRTTSQKGKENRWTVTSNIQVIVSTILDQVR